MTKPEGLARGRLFTCFLFCLVALLTVLAMVRDAAAQGAAAVPAETMLTQGGLYLPADRPGYVIPSTTVDSDIALDIGGLVARARITQRFVNPTGRWVEGVYVFPLPENAAVDRLRMTVGERVVEGVIEEKAQAQRTYAAAAAAGQVASLVSQQRPNIFTTAVANIAPNGSVAVTIEYQQSLAFDGAAGTVSLRFPMVVLPRYIPGTAQSTAPTGTGWALDTDKVPDASRITPPVAAPGTGPVNPVRLSVTLDPGFPVASIESPYHGIEIDEQSGGRFAITLAEGEVWADRDFELVWRPAPGAAPTLGVFSETLADADYHLLLIMPPAGSEASEGAVRPPRELVLVVDTSGSMAGDSIVQAKQAVLDALGRLLPGDSFNVIQFNDRPHALFAAARPVSDQTLYKARNYVRGLVANNGTEMRAALTLALGGAETGGRLRQVVFITDGSVGNEAELFGVIEARLGDSRLFLVGIGSVPNSHFMRGAAEAGRGSFVHIGATQEVGEKMARLFARLERPALTGITVDWPDGVVGETYPRSLPDLYVGEPVLVAAGSQGAARIAGATGGIAWEREAPLTIARDAGGVAALWARSKIAELERERYRGADPQAIRDGILEVALAHRLVSDYTSLVAVDSVVARPPAAPLDTEAVAGNMPAGVTMS
ncbi:MAG: marine proteobacterial sortase target protein, partial [Inquilinus sp.]|nr:marine proteobacterial sortase target protein [Inquilinus sp.]